MDYHSSTEELQQRTIEAFRKEGAALELSFKAVKAGKASALTHQVAIYRRLDDALLAVPDLPGTAPACRPACNYCCHYHVYVSAPEALAIAEHLEAVPAAERDVLLSRLGANAAQAAELGRARHNQTNIRCAFLAEAGDCSIYALRPVACRRHHSYDVTPCRATFEDPTRTDPCPQSLERQATANGFAAAGVALAKHAGVDHARYEMSGAVLEAMTNRAGKKRWRTGRTTFPSVLDRDDTGGVAR